MNKQQALENTIKMWSFIIKQLEIQRDKGITSFDARDIDDLKDEYTEGIDANWQYNCALCEYTMHFSEERCKPCCPECLLEWPEDETLTEEDKPLALRCCAPESPYIQADEYAYGAEFDKAIVQAQIIVDQAVAKLSDIYLDRTTL